jgi:hypothetical protein
MENRRLDLLAAMCDFLTKDISGWFNCLKI